MSSRRLVVPVAGFAVFALVAFIATWMILERAAHRGPAPTGMRMESRTLSSLQLNWDDAPGAITYRVRYWTKDDASDGNAVTFRRSAGTLKDLKERTRYLISVSVSEADESGEKSGWSTAIRAWTKAPAAQLRVGSFNISDPHVDDEDKDGHDWGKRRKAIAADIQEEQVDVVGIQEAYEDADRKSLMSAVNADGGHFAMALPADDFHGRDNRILYDTRRVQLVTAGYEAFPDQVSDDYERTMVWAVLRHKANGHDFLFVTTHLTPENSKKVRLQGLHLIDRVKELNAANNPRLPVVIVGDFNTSKFQKRGSSIIEKMDEAGFGDVLGQQYGTYELEDTRAEEVIDGWVGTFNDYDRDMDDHVVSKDRIGHNIDWIFATNSLRIPRWRTVAHFDDGRLRGVIASDHYLVTADIVLP
jgi:endonuclease/exonuclease/phosphatase family metal-dependent hydrolase